jgi:N-acetyl-beta-hexosaminidase
MEHLNPKEHQIFFRRIGEYATEVNFHHVHIPIPLNKINQVADKAIEKVKAYAKNVYDESMMHYHPDNQYADTKKSEWYALLITDQNIFVTNESAKSIMYFQDDLKSLTSARPTSKTRISN